MSRLSTSSTTSAADLHEDLSAGGGVTTHNSKKRNSNGEAISADEDSSSSSSRARASTKEAKPDKTEQLKEKESSSSSSSKDTKDKDKDKPLKRAKGVRWRTHQHCEDYVNFVGDLMYPKTKLGPYGFEADKGRFPVEKINTLGYFTSPLRRPLVIEKWSPYEIALFESAIMLQGKSFHAIKQYIPTKTVKEIIEFYYEWKTTSHYKQWKAAYKVDDRELPVFDDP